MCSYPSEHHTSRIISLTSQKTLGSFIFLFASVSFLHKDGDTEHRILESKQYVEFFLFLNIGISWSKAFSLDFSPFVLGQTFLK